MTGENKGISSVNILISVAISTSLAYLLIKNEHKQPVENISFDNTTLSGLPKIIQLNDDTAAYYVKAYPTKYN